jgi:tripeptide aminopeptidase
LRSTSTWQKNMESSQQNERIDETLKTSAENRLSELSARILTNLIMVGQIPAPTGHEQERCRYLRDRFTALGLEDIAEDAAGNVVARIKGSEGRKTLAVFAGLDTIFPQEVDHHYTVTPNQVIGPGVCYDSTAASALLSLGEFMQGWEHPLKEDVLLVGLGQCAGLGDQEGMRVFLDSPLSREIRAALVLESIGLGRLSYFSFSALRFDLEIELHPELAFTPGVSRSNAVEILADAVNLLQRIKLPRHPRTSLNLGQIEGGEAHEIWATNAMLGAEIRSENSDVLQSVEEEVDDITVHLSSYYGCQVNLRKFGRRSTAGLRFNHPIVRSLRHLMDRLGIKAAPGPDTMAGSLAMAAGIPTVTLGLTRGQRAGRESYIEIEPVQTGLLQVILALHELGDLLE